MIAQIDQDFAQQHHYVIPPAGTPAETGLVLKNEDAFGVFGPYGDIDARQRGQEGIFFHGSRFLSQSVLKLNGRPPVLLTSLVRRDNVVLLADLTNPDFYTGESKLASRGSLHISRSQFLWKGAFYQRIGITNFGTLPLEIELDLEFAADFADIFEVRGSRRKHEGIHKPAQRAAQGVVLEYEGIDRIRRRTIAQSATHPADLHENCLKLRQKLEPGSGASVELTFAFDTSSAESGSGSGKKEKVPSIHGFEQRLAEATAGADGGKFLTCTIESSNERLNEWILTSRADLTMLLTPEPEGIYPFAGVPWYATPFGRDGIITALQCLWVAPELARGVLEFLTRTQSRADDPEHDAEPGKIIHEWRDDELAAAGEVPFGRYYGSVDATPLYLMLASSYWIRTGDDAMIQAIWPAIEGALGWIDSSGDPDNDGFVEYKSRSSNGLVQHGWKDSQDSIFYADGRLAQGPIALCEVQGYVYAAKVGIAKAAAALHRDRLAGRLTEQAKRTQERFEREFWIPRLGTYAIALDGNKRRCEVRASNPGHTLFCEMISHDRARILADGFFSDALYSGWGIRTIAENEARYNPMSYHNGSIWPFDNSIIAAGLSLYGFTELAARLLESWLEASAAFERSRLPEVFCGFRRSPGKTPVLYPHACSPQAWSAASVFLFLQASLGISLDAMSRRVVLRRPVLPSSIEWITIRNLSVGTASVDLRIFQSADGVAITVMRQSGDLDVVLQRP